MRKYFIILLCSIVVVLAGYVGYRGYNVWKCSHFMALAHRFLAKHDERDALLCVQQVLRTDPRNLDATRTMAQLSTATRSPAALLWWNRVVELSPHSLNDRLDLAQTAIMMRNYEAATNSLAGVDQADKNTVAYQNVAGAVAAAAGQTSQAITDFLQAARLGPDNQNVQLNLAVVRLHDSNDLDQAEARIMLERISLNQTNASLRSQALRELVADALRQRQTEKALTISEQLLQQTNSNFQDRLLRLEVLHATGNAQFKPTLGAFQRQASSDPAQISQLATWEMGAISPGDTLGWLQSLPSFTQTNLTVEVLVAECQTTLRDWHALQSSLEKQNWAEIDFLRHEFMSLALRKQGLADSAKAEWALALQATNGQESALDALLRQAAIWGWQNETEEVLRMIVNRYPTNQRAVQALSELLYLEGRTQSLMEFYNQETKLFPGSDQIKNNLAMTSLLLNSQNAKPYDLAREVYQDSPTNASYVSTYAFSLYRQGKDAEALKVMNELSSADLRKPSRAGYYGLILEATGDPAKARTYLDSSAKALLLPEEKTLFAQAKSHL